jgi:hypothetical protein
MQSDNSTLLTIKRIKQCKQYLNLIGSKGKRICSRNHTGINELKKMISCMDKPLTFIEWCGIINISITDFDVNAIQLIQWFSTDIFNICTMFIRKYVIDQQMRSLSLGFKLKIKIDIILFLKTLQNTINEFNYKIDFALVHANVTACDIEKFKIYINSGFRVTLNQLLQKQTNYDKNICNLDIRLACYQRLMNAYNLNAFILDQYVKYCALPTLEICYGIKPIIGSYGIIGKHNHAILNNYSILNKKNTMEIIINSGISNDLFYKMEEDELLSIILKIWNDISSHYIPLLFAYLIIEASNQKYICRESKAFTEIELAKLFESFITDSKKSDHDVFKKWSSKISKFKQCVIDYLHSSKRIYSYSRIILLMLTKVIDSFKIQDFIISEYFYNTIYKKMFPSLLLLTLYQFAPSILGKQSDPWLSLLKYIGSIGNNNIITKLADAIYASSGGKYTSMYDITNIFVIFSNMGYVKDCKIESIPYIPDKSLNYTIFETFITEHFKINECIHLPPPSSSTITVIEILEDEELPPIFPPSSSKLMVIDLISDDECMNSSIDNSVQYLGKHILNTAEVMLCPNGSNIPTKPNNTNCKDPTTTKSMLGKRPREEEH